jgi:ABC-type branched-subunit amino acid transport system substrate-binding protein
MAHRQLNRAEELFQEGYFAEASRLYCKLAVTFPRSTQAAKALLRQGEIDFSFEHYSKAAAWFQELITRFPQRPEADSARLWLLNCYFELQRFNDAVETGKSLMHYLRENSQQAAAAEIVGNALRAGQKDKEAVRWYVKSYILAEEEKYLQLMEKVDTALDELNRDQVLELLADYPKGFPSTWLETRMVEIDIESGNVALAQKQLQALLEKEPFHPLADRWKNMTLEIEKVQQVDLTAIGCVLPLSGRFRVYGERLLRGLEMAVQDAKILYPRNSDIQLIVKDSAGDAELAVAAIRELVLENNVAAIIGPLSQVAAEPAAKEAQKLMVPIITLTQRESVTDIGNYVFRNFLSNEQQTRALAEYAVLGLGYRHFAILYPNDNYGKKLVTLFANEVSRLEAEVQRMEAYDPSQTDFSTQIKKLLGNRPTNPGSGSNLEPYVASGFEAIFIPDSHSQVGLIAPQLAYHDVTGVRLLGTNLWNSFELIEMAGSYLQGAVFVDGFFSESSRPLTRQFVSRYKDIFDEKPGYPEAQAYDTMRLLIKALDQPEVISRSQLREAILRTGTLFGVTGTASVGPSGEVYNPPLLITIKNKEMEEIQLDFELLRKRRAFLELVSQDDSLHPPAKTSSREWSAIQR